MSKLAKYLISNFQYNWSKPSIKFFRSNGAYGYIIWLTIVKNCIEKKKINIERLAIEIEKYASRRTIIDFITKGVRAGFIKKINDNNDKRKIFIEPTEITIKEYTEWSDEFIKSIV
ncbi:MAG: hypothetical protein HOI39_05385 [Flavobacteriales bacterium]|mgnify:CR=1 FL=1|jgi:hypothetical protein|nr:hypothetical protein [Flavobacteriales bacterium]